ncbi:MAG: hypothetical protein AAGA67_07050 [Cyanobacteria bacterium P01_F01_bin.153]
MTLHFIEAEIDLTESPADLPRAVETELEKRGKPLRWSITKADSENKIAMVEAVITTTSQDSSPNQQ